MEWMSSWSIAWRISYSERGTWTKWVCQRRQVNEEEKKILNDSSYRVIPTFVSKHACMLIKIGKSSFAAGIVLAGNNPENVSFA